MSVIANQPDSSLGIENREVASLQDGNPGHGEDLTPEAEHAKLRAKGRPFVPKGGNDVLFTPPELARDIVAHFMPSGRMLEPCRGAGAFADAMPGCEWCELSEGRDFLQFEGRGYDWILTNPPWSKLRLFLQQSMQVANNIVFLCIVQHIFLTARLRDIEEAGFGIVEICSVPFPPRPWEKGGFPLVAVWIRRGWQGRSPTFTRLKSDLWAPDGSGRMVTPTTAPATSTEFQQNGNAARNDLKDSRFFLRGL